MLAVFLLVGCVVCGEARGFEYLDELYSYYEDDEEVESTVHPGTDTRGWRDPHSIKTLDPQEKQDAEGDAKKTMSQNVLYEPSSNELNKSINPETSEQNTLTNNDNFITKSIVRSLRSDITTSSNIYHDRTMNIRTGKDKFVKEKKSFVPKAIASPSSEFTTNADLYSRAIKIRTGKDIFIRKNKSFVTKSIVRSSSSEFSTDTRMYYNRTMKIRTAKDKFIRDKMKELLLLGKGYRGTTKRLGRGWLRLYTEPTNTHVLQNNSKPLELMYSTRSANISSDVREDYETETTTPEIEPRFSINAHFLNFHDYHTHNNVLLFLHEERRTTTNFEFDADRVLEIVSNITYDSYTNLTEQLLNQAIERMPSVNTNLNIARKNILVARCYICGIQHYGLPEDAACHDAFAGNSLSVFPIDHKSARYLKSYRYSCRFRNGPMYIPDFTRARTLTGRFTGGCSVRWADISGMYTERTCRSTIGPLIGRTFASKRMSSLEASLKDKEEACVASPAATLLPLSRAISLYARIHVCVCKGNFCNAAFRIDTDIWLTSAMAVTAAMLCCNNNYNIITSDINMSLVM